MEDRPARGTNHAATCPSPNGDTNLGTLIWQGKVDDLLACPDVSHDTAKLAAKHSLNFFNHSLLPGVEAQRDKALGKAS